MPTKTVYQRFAKIVPSSELSSWFGKMEKIDTTSLADKATCGKATFEFYQKLRSMLTINTSKFPIYIYPLRAVELYVLSHNKKHLIIDRNITIYRYLLKTGVVTKNDKLSEEFKSYQLLDFERLAELIPNSIVTHEPLYQYQLDTSDFGYISTHPDAEMLGVPCLFEPIAYLEILIPRKSVTEEFKAEMKSKRFEEVKDFAFNIPAEVFSEVLESLSLPF